MKWHAGKWIPYPYICPDRVPSKAKTKGVAQVRPDKSLRTGGETNSFPGKFWLRVGWWKKIGTTCVWTEISWLSCSTSPQIDNRYLPNLSVTWNMVKSPGLCHSKNPITKSVPFSIVASFLHWFLSAFLGRGTESPWIHLFLTIPWTTRNGDRHFGHQKTLRVFAVDFPKDKSIFIDIHILLYITID